MPYSHNIINDHKATEKVWKTQLNMHVSFICSKDTGETCTIYVLSDKKTMKQIILLKNF